MINSIVIIWLDIPDVANMNMFANHIDKYHTMISRGKLFVNTIYYFI